MILPMSNLNGIKDIDYKLQSLLDGTLDPAGLAQLEAALLNDAEVRQYCMDTLLTVAALRRSSLAAGIHSEHQLLDMLAGLEGAPGAGSRRWLPVLCVAAALLIGLALAWVLVRRGPSGPVTGHVVRQVQAQWDHPYYHLEDGMALHVGPIRLRSGSAEIQLDRGVRMLLQAPCDLELDTANRITVQRGKFVAHVEDTARGFSVHAPTAVITDLGTEFGVMVQPGGPVEAHVFSGRVTVALDANRVGQDAPLLLETGQATIVSRSGRRFQGPVAAEPDRFMLELPDSAQAAAPGRCLSLADIAGGGNGYGTGTFDQGYDLATGDVFHCPVSVIQSPRQHQFNRLTQSRAIDGLFVPDSTWGPVTISSTGLIFNECPATGGSYYGGVANSAKILSMEEPDHPYQFQLGVTVYGTPAHPALYIHPNAGITFDLAHLRADNPGTRIVRFTAQCGISTRLPQPRKSAADAWILLDGKTVFHLHCPQNRNSHQAVSLSIPLQARFLTLVTTCPRDAGYSWLFFGDPVLEMRIEP